MLGDQPAARVHARHGGVPCGPLRRERVGDARRGGEGGGVGEECEERARAVAARAPPRAPTPHAAAAVAQTRAQPAHPTASAATATAAFASARRGALMAGREVRAIQTLPQRHDTRLVRVLIMTSQQLAQVRHRAARRRRVLLQPQHPQLQPPPLADAPGDAEPLLLAVRALVPAPPAARIVVAAGQ